MAWIAPIAAAASKKREQEEEERMMVEWLAGEEEGDERYEYKILRSTFGAFANRAKRAAALDEEAHAGWELAAVLDGERLILRRPVSMRQADAVLPPEVDPYRGQIGAELPIIAGLVGVLLLGMVAFGLFVGLGGSVWPVIVLIGILLLAVVFVLKLRRR